MQSKSSLRTRLFDLVGRNWHWLRVVIIVSYVILSGIVVVHAMLGNADPLNGVSDQ